MNLSGKESIRTDKLSLPPALFTSQLLGPIKGESEAKYTMIVGLNDELVGKLASYSHNDQHHSLRGQEGSNENFSHEGYAQWYSKANKTPFALLDSSKNLVAIIWIGTGELPQDPEEATLAAEQDFMSMSFFGGMHDEQALKNFLQAVLSAYTGSCPGRKIFTTTDGHGADFSSILGSANFKARESDGAKTMYIKG